MNVLQVEVLTMYAFSFTISPLHSSVLFITDLSSAFDRYGKDDRRYHLMPQLYFGESSCGLVPNIMRKDSMETLIL